MYRQIWKKVGIALLTIYFIITISFMLIHIMPGDPIIHLVGQEEYYYLLDNDPETLNKMIEKYGLNDSLSAQYFKYLKSIVTFDFGISYTNQKMCIRDRFKGTMFRQTMFAEFEKITHAAVEAGETMTADRLCEIYHKLNQFYFGDQMISDPQIAVEWARIPHFYTPFYVCLLYTSMLTKKSM